MYVYVYISKCVSHCESLHAVLCDIDQPGISTWFADFKPFPLPHIIKLLYCPSTYGYDHISYSGLEIYICLATPKVACVQLCRSNILGIIDIFVFYHFAILRWPKHLKPSLVQLKEPLIQQMQYRGQCCPGEPRHSPSFLGPFTDLS